MSQENKETESSSGGKISKVRTKIGKALRIKNTFIRVFLAELIGTFVFISFSLAGVAQYVFGGKKSFLSLNVSFGFGLTMGIITSGNVSGGHLNPAVSLSMLLLGRLTFVKFILYVIAQNIGAFLAAVMVYLVYLFELENYSGGMNSLDTAGIFATFPNQVDNVTGSATFSLFWDQFFATSLFIFCILAITDPKSNQKTPLAVTAVLVGLILLIVGTSFGLNCGFAVNPARDFAPRLFLLIAGWGGKVFSAGNYFFWIPLVAPIIASFSSVFFYQLFIGNHTVEEEEEEVIEASI